MTRNELRAHLDFFSELGISGVSQDVKWRARRDGSEPFKNEALESASSKDELGALTKSIDKSVPSGTKVVQLPGEALVALRADLGDCTRCKLHSLGRKNIVFGVGNPEADLMFIGEAPGSAEDIQGVPFVGRAGQLLTKIIESIGLKREQVYIANVIKCRPPKNRNPEADEVEQCLPFLFGQIDIIKPRIIVALGRFAAQSLLVTSETITSLRGREHQCRSSILIATYHPAYLLRNPSAKRDVWEDMKRVRTLLSV